MNAHKNFPKISRVFSMDTIRQVMRGESPQKFQLPVILEAFFSVSAMALTISVAKRRGNDTRIPPTITSAPIPALRLVEHQKNPPH